MLIKRRQLGINFAHPTARKIVSLWVVENGSWRDLYNRDLVASLVNGATIAKARSDRLSVARECLRLNQTANNAAILTSSRLSGQLGGKPCTAFVFANLIAVDSNGAFLAPALSCNTNVVSDVSCEVGSLTFDSTPKPRYIGYQVPSDGYARYGYINGVLRGTRSTYPVVSAFPTGSFDFRWGSDAVSTFYDANAEIFMSGLGYGSMFGEADHALLWTNPFALTKVTRTTYIPTAPPTTTPRLLTVRRKLNSQPPLGTLLDEKNHLYAGLTFDINPATGVSIRGKKVVDKSRPDKKTQEGFVYSAARNLYVPVNGVSTTAWSVGWFMRWTTLGGMNARIWGFGDRLYALHRFNSSQDVTIGWRDNSASAFDSRASFIPTVGVPYSYMFVRNGTSGWHYVNGESYGVVGSLGVTAQINTDTFDINSDAKGDLSHFSFWESRVLSAEEVRYWHRSHWAMYQKQRPLQIPIGSYPLGPYLSNATYINLTSSGFQPRVTLTMP